MNRIYEYEDQYGNLFWSLRKPQSAIDVGLKLRHQGRLGMHPYHFVDRLRARIRTLLFNKENNP
jgi:hypothetical protein